MKIINLILMMIISSCSTNYGTTSNIASVAAAGRAELKKEVSITWGGGRGQMISTGNSDLIISLSMDKASGSGFQSNNQYLFGKLDMQIKLVQGNSAGTVTAYYLSSQGVNHDEIDFEFLGNSSGEPYTLHTNVFTQGKGNREQQFFMWFDPTTDFHTYTILWNTQQILFLVDGTPIRVFHNVESRGVPYPKDQPMRLYASLWDAEAWATRGGLVKTDWSKAPFKASFRNFAIDACIVNGGKSSCNGSPTKGPWWAQSLGTNDKAKLEWVQKNYMVYDYCRDRRRFPQGFPLECSISP